MEVFQTFPFCNVNRTYITENAVLTPNFFQVHLNTSRKKASSFGANTPVTPASEKQASEASEKDALVFSFSLDLALLSFELELDPLKTCS